MNLTSPPSALQQHVLWEALLAGFTVFGPGAWAAERWLWPWLRAQLGQNKGHSSA